VNGLSRFIITAALIIFSQVLFAADTITFPTRPGVTQSFFLEIPDNPLATVVLFAGGSGYLGMKERGKFTSKKHDFLVRSRQRFLDAGFAVAMFDSPSDHSGSRGMWGGFRTSFEHAQDIIRVANYLRLRVNAPVWLIGTSRGTVSVANAAIHATDQLDGIVLTSCISKQSKSGEALPELALDKIRVPVMLAAHTDDKCSVTPAEGTCTVREQLTGAPDVFTEYFSGGKDAKLNECAGLSAHGFYGIEEQVVDSISGFIRRHSQD